MPTGYIRAPDSRQGSGYSSVSSGGANSAVGSERLSGGLWPYFSHVEDLSDLDDELEKDKEAIAKKTGEYSPSDHLGQLNYKPHSFVGGSTRGLTGIMSSVEAKPIIESLAAAIGQASPSYNVNGADGTTRTRPGRKTGTKKGYFSAPPQKETDPREPAYTLKDIADNQKDKDVKSSKITKNKIRYKNMQSGMNEAILRAYVRNVIEIYDDA